MGCATRYQPQGLTGGYTDTPLGNDEYLITVAVNAYTDETTAYQYFHRRAQEIVREEGYERYEVLELISDKAGSMTYIGDKPYFFERPRVYGRIKCYREELSPPPVSSSPPVASRPSIIEQSGTGFALTKTVIVTNNHVIDNAESIAVVFKSQTMSAKILVQDPINDVALLEISGFTNPPLQPLPLGDPTTVQGGASVFTGGYPLSTILGSTLRMGEGIVNSVVGFDDDPRMFQISIPLQPGNSGGPLLDTYGNVIGVVTETLSAVAVFKYTGQIPQNVNFALKGTYITALVDMFPAIRKTVRPRSQKKLGSSEIFRACEHAIVAIQATVLPPSVSPPPRSPIPPPSVSVVSPPDTLLEPYSIHPAVGDTIDHLEAAQYEIFQGIPGFLSARYYRRTKDGIYWLEYTAVDAGGRTYTRRNQVFDVNIDIVRRAIEQGHKTGQ
jgi:S1-C subfamily serine protease